MSSFKFLSTFLAVLPSLLGQSRSASVVVDARTVVRTIPKTIYGTNTEWIFDGYGLWDPAAGRLNENLVSLTQQAKPGLIRYPGGFFADYFHWNLATLPQSQRTSQSHYPGGPSSIPHFGPDEVLAFADRVGAPVLFTVNVVTGSSFEAAAWVQHTNALSPGRVPYWEIGNESYGSSGSEESQLSSIDPQTYASRVVAFSRAMKKVDPSIQVGAIGGLNYSYYNLLRDPDWNAKVLPQVAADIDFLSIHNAYYPFVFGERNPDVARTYRALLAAPVLVRQNLVSLSQQLDLLAPIRPIKIAVTEWGPFFDTDLQGPVYDHVKTMASALYVASMLKVFIETPKVEIANFFKLVDNLFVGWIGMNNDTYLAKAPLLAASLFTNNFGERVVISNVTSPTFDAEGVGLVPPIKAVPYLDVISSLSADGQSLFVIAINKSLDQPTTLNLSILGFAPRSTFDSVTLLATAPDANTGTKMPLVPGFTFGVPASYMPGGRILFGGPTEVQIHRSTASFSGSFSQSLPPYSITSLHFTAQSSRGSFGPPRRGPRRGEPPRASS